MCFRLQMADISENLGCEMIQNLKTEVIRDRWQCCSMVMFFWSISFLSPSIWLYVLCTFV